MSVVEDFIGDFSGKAETVREEGAHGEDRGGSWAVGRCDLRGHDGIACSCWWRYAWCQRGFGLRGVGKMKSLLRTDLRSCRVTLLGHSWRLEAP